MPVLLWRMDRIEVVRSGNLQKGASTLGILREKAFESSKALVSKSTVAPGTISSWHHHGARNLYGFVLSGRLRLECMKGQADSVDVESSDFFHIPPGLVHRDVNPGKTDAVIVNVLIGEGPAAVNVEG